MQSTEFRSLTLESTGLKLKNAKLNLLDQRLLPDHETWLDVTSSDHLVGLIKNLSVRGAPLLGVAAALQLACSAFSKYDKNRLQSECAKLKEARPTAVNLMWAIDSILKQSPDLEPEAIATIAVEIFRDDVRMCEKMATCGAALVENGDGILTICNSGGLATVGIGTAFAVIRKAHELGKNIHVFACETRPLLQGARLTTWELKKLGIPHTLITDSMAASVMRSGGVQRIFTGADRVSKRGDFANKIGTYSLAVSAHHHAIPFYPVAPWSTVDPFCQDGAAIPIEERPSHEVLGFINGDNHIRWAPEETKVFNPSFDVTPADLVTGLVLDRGYFSVREFQALF